MKWINKIPVWIVILVVPILFIGPTISSYHFALGSEYNDIQITHAPNYMFIQKSILEDGQIPFWNPHILSGYPFDADPMSGLWYPPGWLALIFPQPFGINLVLILHIFLGGVGFYFYLLQIGIPKNISLFAGICLTLLPKVYAHFGAGHATYLMAFTITPWLLYSTTLRGRKRWLMQVLCMGGIILADVRWAPYGLLMWLAAELHQVLGQKESNPHTVRLNAIRLVESIAVSLGVAACLLIPFFLYISLSTRSLLTTADHMAFSLPPDRLLTWVFPTPGGSPEWMIFTGIGLIFLALIALLKQPTRQIAPWVVVVIIAAVFSLGENIPELPALSNLPLLNLLRVPPRILFAASLAIILLAAYGFDSLMQLKSVRTGKSVLILAFLLLLASALIAGIMRQQGDLSKQTWLITPLVMFCYLVLVIFHLNRNLSSSNFMMGMSVILFLEIGLVAKTSFIEKPLAHAVDISTITQLDLQPGERLYSPSFSIGQDQAVSENLSLVQGIHPIQSIEFVKFLSKASGVKADRYSVVQPPLKTGDPRGDNRDATPDSALLDRLNAVYVVSSYPVALEGWSVLQPGPDVWMYKNLKSTGFPILVSEDGQNMEIETIRYSANRVEYLLEGPGIIQTAELNYPGWVATVDGKRVNLETEMSLFRAIRVPAGSHRVVMVYQPWWTYLGIGISILTLVGLIWVARKQK